MTKTILLILMLTHTIGEAMNLGRFAENLKPVDNIDRTVQFYQKLGFKVAHQTDWGLVQLKRGTEVVGLMPESLLKKPSTVYFLDTLDQLKTLRDDLKAAGIDVDDHTSDETAHLGFEDPSGNAISVVLDPPRTEGPAYIRQMAFALLYVDDLQENKAFYEKYLDFKQEQEFREGEIFGSMGKIQVWMGSGYKRKTSSSENETRATMMVNVDSSVRLHGLLKKDGHRVLQDEPIEMQPGSFWFQFEDPSGNIVDVLGGH